jgi:hypothetical protein
MFRDFETGRKGFVEGDSLKDAARRVELATSRVKGAR